jgi:hypothetical protein
MFVNSSTNVDRDQVREELRRILVSPAFQNSKRYAAVLRYIVDQTLKGAGEQLKERTIGIAVFDRPPDYDTGTDHVVRSAVAEVRKRLAQYYVNSASTELRIEIVAGSYVPQFRRCDDLNGIVPAPVHAAPIQSEPAAEQRKPEEAPRKAWLRPVWVIASCLVLSTCVIAVVATSIRPNPALTSFWNPILSSRTPVLLCIGNIEGGQRPDAASGSTARIITLSEFQNSAPATVSEYDAFALAKLAGLLQAKGMKFRLVSQSDATFTDLQNGPTILVGLLNNNWTERLLPKLRFTVEEPAPNKYMIRDRKNASNNDWSIDYSEPYLDVPKDYALVTRMVDPKTGQTVVVVAGVSVFGTSAAADFLTDGDELKKLAAVAPPGWEKKNMELVLSTEVIRGRWGRASVVAAQFW